MTDPDIKKIEQLLKEYPVMKSKLNIKLIQNKNREYSLPAYNYAKVSGGETNTIYSDIEEYVAMKDELEGETLDLFRKVKAIESGLKCLNKHEYMTIKLYYFKNYTYVEIELELNRCTTTLQKYKNDALKKLKRADLHKIY